MTDNPLNHRWSHIAGDPPRFWHRIDDINPDRNELIGTQGAMQWKRRVRLLTFPNGQATVLLYGDAVRTLTRDEARELGAALLAAAARAGGVFPGYELTDDQVAEIMQANWSRTEEQG